MVYLLLLLLGLVVLVQSYLMFSLLRNQRDLQAKVDRLLKEQRCPKPNKRKMQAERGRVR